MTNGKQPRGFIVSARTYRPQRFEDLIGQEHVTRILQNAIRLNRIAHAYVFSGPRGVGKTTAARILAKALNCLHFDKPTPEPCQECPSCVSITQGTSVDVIEIDGASNRGIDEVRELRENARLRPALSRCKVFYIDEVHMLTKEAFNALLKILEEPPEHVRFVMSTTEEQRIPETIASRCQVFRFRLIHSTEVFQHLKMVAENQSGAKIEDGVYSILTRAGGGSMRDSLSLLDQILSLSDERITTADAEMILGMVAFETLDKTVKHLHKGELPEMISLVNEVAEAGKDMVQLARDLVDHYRCLLVARNAPKPEKILTVPPEEIEQIKKTGKEITDTEILTAVEILWEAETRMRYLPDPRMVLEMALLKIAKLNRMVEIEDLLSRLDKLEKKLGNVPAGSPSPSGNYGDRRESQPAPAQDRPSTGSAGTSWKAPIGKKEEGAPSDMRDALQDPPQEDVSPLKPGNGLVQTADMLWDKVRQIVHDEKPSIGGCLTVVRPVAEEKGVLVLGVPEGSRFHYEKLARNDSREVLEPILARVLGRPVSYTCRFHKFDGSPAPNGPQEEAAPSWPRNESKGTDMEALRKEEPVLDKILNLFGGRIIEVKEKTIPPTEPEGDEE